MADTRAEDLLFKLSWADAVHLGLLLLLAAAAVGFCPNLEDLSTQGFVLLAAYSAAGALFLLGGGAWTFDAPNKEEAELRYLGATTLAYVMLCLLFLLYLLQGSDVGGKPHFLLRLAALGAAFLGMTHWPREQIQRWEKNRAPTQAAADYVVQGEASSERPAESRPAVSAVLPPGVEALLVSSGTFKMDRARMLEMLSRYQFADPKGFLLPWLRLAVASGAARIELLTKGDGIEMRFDGKPLDAALLRDPYACFMEEGGKESARHRHFGYGLLTLYRLEPRSVSVVSGEARLRVALPGVAVKDEEPSIPGTLIRVRWDSMASRLLVGECLTKARDAFGLCDVRLFIDGQEAPPPWAAYQAEAKAFKEGSTWGVVLPALDTEYRNWVHFYVQGVFVEKTTPKKDSGHFMAFVTDPGLTMSLSQSGILQDDAFKRAMACAEKYKKIGGRSTLAERFAYTQSGLFAALGAAGAAFGAFVLAVEKRPDLAFAAGTAYAGVTLAMLGFCARWFHKRLSGLRNPFRK